MALLESFSIGEFSRSFKFEELESVVEASTPDQVIPVFREIEAAVSRGRHAVGFVAYGAATALNPELSVQESSELPLVWFGVFRNRRPADRTTEPEAGNTQLISQPELEITREEYTSAVAGIRDSIAAGETYQVNFTTRQSFRVSGDHFALYRRMCANQRAPFCAWLDTGSHRILSASPELFFSLKNGLLTMKPMKGTASRKPLNHEDLLQREMLGASSKERAENLMIVDLVRNDLSRIAETGSVEVPSLFEVQTFPTLHQMTSTVTARLRPDTGLVDIFRALFPCGSVTGAPKRRTMEIIREREQSGRGIYCGAIGFVSPGGEAVFSVAIRTAVLESSSGSGSMGIGSGITWDSEPEAEFRECLAKGTFLTRTPAEFKLIESLLHDHNGYLLLERHLLRLEESAEYFGFSFPLDRLRSEFEQLGQTLSGRHKVRVLLTENGDITLEAQEIADSGKFGQQLLVAVAEQRVDSSDPFLYHKTTRRALYDSERRTHPQSGEVIFLNERGEVTEGCFNNIVISRGGELLTPAVGCGLLPGVLREELIEVGAIREAILTLTDISNADRLWLINSVRGWREGIMLKMAQP
ncbi:MAG: aminodeoxychorismate synthase component I [Desulfuromonadales bacterium]|nr:aminodeoxychorismate synthase component I [Desulfuromonadales bacterium]